MHLVHRELQNTIIQGHVPDQEKENENPVWKSLAVSIITFS